MSTATTPGAAAAPSGQPFWQARTGSGLHPDLLAYSQTTQEDLPYLPYDLAGSSAHVLGLRKAGLLGDDEASQLLAGLRGVLRDHEAGTFTLDVELEDAHMNVEARLTRELGDVGRKLHSGRSRNDQVATCITLYARSGLAELAQALHNLSVALARQARTHARTPWVARTHGQPAQPATVGFLLAAHAHRLQDAAVRVTQAFEAVGESPLGSGAVAGSTLPLEPAYTARLMGLRPPRSALLATGTRDTVLAAVDAAAAAGVPLAGLCQDLLDAFTAGALRLPPGYTTGSSLMPQKRNPDALELARGRARGLSGPAAAVHAMVDGLGLGYQRDFQLTKPWLAQSLQDATATAALLAPLVEGMTFDGAANPEWAKPGIVATDIAEALVKAGLPFRTAYRAVADVYAAVERGATLADALAQAPLDPEQAAAAVAATQPDPARRATHGGPAPVQLGRSLDDFEARAAELARALAAAGKASEAPFDLLSTPIPELLETTR